MKKNLEWMNRYLLAGGLVIGLLLARGVSATEEFTFSGWQDIGHGALGCYWTDGKIYAAYPGREGFLRDGIDYTIKENQSYVTEATSKEELKEFAGDAKQRLSEARALLRAFDIL